MSDKSNVKKLAIKTLTKYSVDTVDVNSIKNIVVALGYTVIRFSSLGSTDQTQKLLEALYLDDRIAFQDSFTYNDRERRIVFIRRDISDDEFLYLLAVELGRILTFRTECDGVIGISAEEDRTAHEFAFYICDLSRHGLLYNLCFCYKVPVIFASTAFTICLSLLISFFIVSALHYNKQGQDDGAELFKRTLNAVSEFSQQEDFPGIPSADSSVMLNFSNNILENEQNEIVGVPSAGNEVVFKTYYATKSGTKYHVADCGYISGKDTVVVSQSDISSGKYSPCSRCID